MHPHKIQTFLYFVPDETIASAVTEDALRKHGLFDAFHDWNILGNNLLTQKVASGPDGKSGVFIAPRPIEGVEPKTRSFHQGITWKKFKDEHYVGVDGDEMPSPMSFARKEFFSGYRLDGTEWDVPVIRSPGRRNQSWSSSLQYNPETGEVEAVASDRWQGLWDLTQEIMDRFGGDEVDVDHAWILDTAIKILQVNYRITKSCLMFLAPTDKLFQVDNLVNVLLYSCDWPLLNEFKSIMDEDQKKTEHPTQELASA